MAWISKPHITVIVYIPSWPPMAEMSSISTILPAIRNRIPIGAYLRMHDCYCVFILHQLHPSIHPSWYLPHDYGHQPHDGFIERVKEVLEGLSLFPHAPDDQSKADGEHHQTESIYSIDRPRNWDQLLPGNLLAIIEREYRLIHCHRHMDYSLGIVSLELDFNKERQ